MQTIIEIKVHPGSRLDSALSAEDIARMIIRYIDSKGFILHSLSIEDHAICGYLYFLFVTDAPYELLKSENRIHNITRLSEVITRYRLASFVDVTVCPFDKYVLISDNDFIVDKYIASGSVVRVNESSTRIRCAYGDFALIMKKDIVLMKRVLTCLMGNKIEKLKNRRYVLYPYFQITDHENGKILEGETDVMKVLNGELDLITL
jgi:hypothetical protein